MMMKSILAVSEGGPDATMSFQLAARVAAEFDGAVDALHLPVGPAGGMVGGLAMSGEAMPLIMNLDDERLEARRQAVATALMPSEHSPRSARQEREIICLPVLSQVAGC